MRIAHGQRRLLVLFHLLLCKLAQQFVDQHSDRWVWRRSSAMSISSASTPTVAPVTCRSSLGGGPAAKY